MKNKNIVTYMLNGGLFQQEPGHRIMIEPKYYIMQKYRFYKFAIAVKIAYICWFTLRQNLDFRQKNVL